MPSEAYFFTSGPLFVPNFIAGHGMLASFMYSIMASSLLSELAKTNSKFSCFALNPLYHSTNLGVSFPFWSSPESSAGRAPVGGVVDGNVFRAGGRFLVVGFFAVGDLKQAGLNFPKKVGPGRARCQASYG